LRPLALGAALVAVLALVPLVAAKYQLTLMIPFFSYGIALLGLNLLFGYTGLLSFGHAMFLGIGAYTAAVFTGILKIASFELILLTAALLGGLVALPIGALCVRYTKIFFGMLTLAFGMLFHSFLFKFYAITGGDEGMTVRRPSLLGHNFAGFDKTSFLGGPFYYYCLVLLALLGFLMWRIVRSPFGLHLRAIRENPSKAQYLGVRVRRFRLFAFVISGAYGAIGGAILAVNTGLADPELAYWTQSGNLVFMTVLGGFGNFLGPIVGALAFIFLQDELMGATQYWRFFMGAILAIIVIVLPRGLTGLAVDLASGPVRRWWPAKARA
jgi:branched-chain amino acid transport system permease protein